MDLPLVRRVLDVLSFLNGTGTSRGKFDGYSIPATDMATLRRVNVR